MISVPVCVQNEAQLLIRDPLQRRANLVSERRKLIVNDQDPIVADRHADISAGAFKHVNVAGNFRYFDLNLRKVLLRVD